ncbi:MAG: plasmid maintenance protein CcdB [Myxococcales bacterium]|nr:plasmid maintenance protein CcdB [Myxococcales bacterium]
MAQFDVHRNLGAHRDHIPFVVVVQSRRLDAYRRRVVIPLVLAAAVQPVEPNLNPTFHIESLDVVLHPLELVSIAVERLGERVGTLGGEGDRIIAAIDMVISRAWK